MIPKQLVAKHHAISLVFPLNHYKLTEKPTKSSMQRKRRYGNRNEGQNQKTIATIYAEFDNMLLPNHYFKNYYYQADVYIKAR